MKLLCTLALSGVVEALAPAFETAHEVRLRAEFLPTAMLMPRLQAGEAAEAAIVTSASMDELVGAGLIPAASRRDLARSFVGVAVRAGAARPDIGTEEAFVAALHAAGSVSLSRQGASGLFLAGLLRRMGLWDMVQAKAIVIDSGYTATLAASGEVELALQQISELMVVPGVDIVGRIPASLGGTTVFSGGVPTGTGRPHLGGALLAAIAGAEQLLQEGGLEKV